MADEEKNETMNALEKGNDVEVVSTTSLGQLIMAK